MIRPNMKVHGEQRPLTAEELDELDLMGGARPGEPVAATGRAPADAPAPAHPGGWFSKPHRGFLTGKPRPK